MFILYCAMLFAAQFKYILSFGFAGISFTPVRVCFLILIIVDLISSRGKIKFNKKNNVWLWVMLAWNIWALLSFIWAKEKSLLFGTELILFEALGFIYYGQKLITSAERVKAVFNVLLFACVIHNALGWLEITTKIYLFSQYTEKYAKLGYPVSTFTNTNNFGFYLVLMSVVLMGIIFVSRNRNYRIVSAVLLTSSLLLLFKTGSRGAVINVFVGAVLFILLLRKNLKFTLVIGGLLIAVLVLIMVYPTALRAVEELYQNAFKVDVNASSGSDFYRMHLLANGLDFYGATYGFGVGCVSPNTLFSAEWPWVILALFFLFAEKPDLLTFSALNAAHKKRVVIRFGKRALPI